MLKITAATSLFCHAVLAVRIQYDDIGWQSAVK
jgi:hypothetical protein